MKTYTAAQMRQREQAAVDAGTSFEQLMENAGRAAAAARAPRRPFRLPRPIPARPRFRPIPS